MFLGQYSYTLDSKGRLTIPSRYRDYLQGELVVTRGMDHCLTVYPIEMWREITTKVNALPLMRKETRQLRRYMYADAVNVELDKQGRILVPDRLRELAGLELSEEVLIVGVDTFIELWNPKRWAEDNNDDLMGTVEDLQMWQDNQL